MKAMNTVQLGDQWGIVVARGKDHEDDNNSVTQEEFKSQTFVPEQNQNYVH